MVELMVLYSRWLLRFSTLVLTAVLIVAPAMPQQRHSATPLTFFVSPNGNDHNDGSARRPWKTIQHANERLRPGMTVRVAPGKYDGPVQTTVSGTPALRIRLVSEEKWKAQITTSGRQLAAWTVGSGAQDGNYVDIEGFDITGSARNGILVYGSYDRVLKNHVHDLAVPCDNNGGSGINSQNVKASDNEVDGNVVHGIHPDNCKDGRYHGVGIYFLNPRGKITNNIVHSNGSVGIQLSHNSTDEVVANNLAFSNAYVGIWVGCADNGCVLNDNTIVTNNIVLNHSGCGIRERGATGRHNVYDRNIMYGNQGGDFCLQNGNPAGSSIRIDPSNGTLFVNWQKDGTGDYHLSPQSPAINAGSSLGAPAADFDGSPRAGSDKIDIGPFENRPSSTAIKGRFSKS